MNFHEAPRSDNYNMELYITTELLRLIEDANSMVKFNAETSLCRLFALHLDTKDLPQAEQFAKAREQLAPLCSKMKQKFKTRSLDAPADIDVSCLNL